MDFEKYRPWIVLVESTIPCTNTFTDISWENRLIKNNYKYVYFDGLNRYYISSEHSDLEKAFEIPANVGDGFISYNNVKDSANEIIKLQKEIKEYQLKNCMVMGSLSWKITVPIRAINKLVYKHILKKTYIEL